MTFFSPDSTSTSNLTKQLHAWLPQEHDSYLKIAGKEILTRTVCLVVMPIFCAISATFQTATFVLKTPFVIITLPFALFLNVPKNLQFSEWLLHVSQVYLLFMRVVVTPIAFFSPSVCCAMYAAIELSHRKGLNILFEQAEMRAMAPGAVQPPPNLNLTKALTNNTTATHNTTAVATAALSLAGTLDCTQPGALLPPTGVQPTPTATAITPPRITATPIATPNTSTPSAAAKKAKLDADKAEKAQLETAKAEAEKLRAEQLGIIKQKKADGVALEPDEIILEHIESFSNPIDKNAYLEKRKARETRAIAEFCTKKLTIYQVMQRRNATLDPVKKLEMEKYVLNEEVKAIALDQEEATEASARKNKLAEELALKQAAEKKRFDEIKDLAPEFFSDEQAIFFYVYQLSSSPRPGSSTEPLPSERQEYDDTSTMRKLMIKSHIEKEMKDIGKRIETEFSKVEAAFLKTNAFPHLAIVDRPDFINKNSQLDDAALIDAYKKQLGKYVGKVNAYLAESKKRQEVIQAQYRILTAEEVEAQTNNEFLVTEATRARKEIARKTQCSTIDPIEAEKQDKIAKDNIATANAALKAAIATKAPKYTDDDFESDSGFEFDY